MSSGCRKAALIAGVGCLAIPIVLALVVAGLFFWGKSVSEREGPGRPEATSLTLPVGAPVVPGRDLLGATPGPAPSLPEPKPVQLSLRLEEGNFRIEPGPPGSDVKVDGFFDPRDYELTQKTEEAADGSRSIEVTFRRKRSWIFLIFNPERNRENKVTVTIPQGVPTDLSLRLAKCQSKVDLGGLKLTGLQASFAMGDQDLTFSRPIEGSMEVCSFRARMGNIDLRGLGNARTRALDFRGSMGDVRVDFSGEWLPGTTTTATVRASMGDFRITLPKGLTVHDSTRISLGESRRHGLEEEPVDPNAPVLNLVVSASMGDIRIVRE